MSDLPGKEEQCCANCFYCFPRETKMGDWECDNVKQIRRTVNLNDYCIYHEPLYTQNNE